MALFPLLDVSIGLCFIYLLLSLVCSSLSEGLEGLLRNRANDLEAGIRLLLSDPNKHNWLASFLPWANSIQTGITREFYRHPLIRSLFRSESRLPDYIPARNFSLAILDLMFPDAPPLDLPPSLKRSVTLLINAAEGDAERARANIEGWFNNAMDRVSGWYKHRAQCILFGIGLFVTIGVNADSIQILSTLAHGQSLDLGIGWKQDWIAGDQSIGRVVSLVGVHWMGWLMTAAAISLGAPFWFDTLSRFMVVRSTIKPTLHYHQSP